MCVLVEGPFRSLSCVLYKAVLPSYHHCNTIHNEQDPKSLVVASLDVCLVPSRSCLGAALNAFLPSYAPCRSLSPVLPRCPESTHVAHRHATRRPCRGTRAAKPRRHRKHSGSTALDGEAAAAAHRIHSPVANGIALLRGACCRASWLSNTISQAGIGISCTKRSSQEDAVWTNRPNVTHNTLHLHLSPPLCHLNRSSFEHRPICHSSSA